MVVEIFNTILFVFISDDNHDTIFVYKNQTILFDYLKENLPIRDKIFFFSDGCGENFINLCHHQQDLNMDAEWILFATSHGRPGDGVGGLIY